MVLLACCGAVALADDVAAAVADGGASEVDAAVAVVVEDEASLSSAPDVVGVAADVAAASEVAGPGSRTPLPAALPLLLHPLDFGWGSGGLRPLCSGLGIPSL